MKISRKSLLLLSILALLSLSLGGIVQAQETVLTVTWWGSQNRHDRTIAAIELFEAANPSINVEYEFSSWSDYWTRLNTQVAGGNVACVMQQDYPFLTEWASRGLLMPLDGLFEYSAIDVSNIDQSILDSGMVGDETFGLSLGTPTLKFSF